MKLIRITAACVIVLFLAACSAPAGLDRLMEGFEQAAKNNEGALKDLDETSAQRLTEIRHKRAIEGKNAAGVAVRIRPNSRANCRFDAPGCDVRLMTREEADSKNDNAGEALDIENLIPNQLAVSKEISIYAAGLKSTAAADNTEQIRNGLSNAMEGVCGLAGTLGAMSGVGAVAAPACEAFRVPVVSVAAFVYGEYQTQAKLSALRAATSEMQPLLTAAAKHFSVAAGLAIDGDVTRLSVAYDSALKGWEDNRSEASLTALLAGAANLDAALKSRSELSSDRSVFWAFETAHQKIANALTNKTSNLSAAIAEIKILVTKTKELAKIAKAFKEATEKARNLEVAEPQ